MAHIHDKYDYVVTVYIVYDGKVLLVEHPRYNMWLPMGGHVELDEDPEMTLFREIKEETGLEVEILGTKPELNSPGTKSIFTPMFVDVHETNTPGHKHIGLVYFAKAKNDKFVLSSEHTAINWVGLDDLDSPKYDLVNAVKFYSKKAIEAAG